MTAVAPGARVRPASPMARVASYLIDLAAVAATGAIGLGLTRSWVIFAVVVFEAAVVFTLTRAATGLTLGALATRTIAHTFATAHAPGLHRQSLRSLLMGVLPLSGAEPDTLAQALSEHWWLNVAYLVLLVVGIVTQLRHRSTADLRASYR